MNEKMRVHAPCVDHNGGSGHGGGGEGVTTVMQRCLRYSLWVAPGCKHTYVSVFQAWLPVVWRNQHAQAVVNHHVYLINWCCCVFSLRTSCACAPRPLPSDDCNAVARGQQKHPGGDGVKGVLVHEIADDENQRHLCERRGQGKRGSQSVTHAFSRRRLKSICCIYAGKRSSSLSSDALTRRGVQTHHPYGSRLKMAFLSGCLIRLTPQHYYCDQTIRKRVSQ